MTTPPAIARDVTNDFSLVVATANGTGSQTANLALLRACFHMGIPVCGKNIFPSNIQGLPTWYHIRVSKDGYVARRTSEVLVAFNQATVDADLRELPSGGVAVVDAGLAHGVERDDIHVYAIPVKALMAASEHKGKLRDYLANMTYVGVLAHLLEIPLDAIEAGLDAQFGGKRRLVDTNLAVVRGAHAWAVEELTKTDPFRVAPMDATRDLLIMSGNEAGALGSVFGGVSVAAWYPITPSTSFIDALRDYLPELRQGEDGVPTYTVIQAEDELAAIGMVIGAGFAGARALTATSGPGISLMAEFAGLGSFAEVPGVIWDVQRVGPSTGLPTRTSQGDLAFAYGLGHGDGKHVVLLPSSIEECFEFGWRSFDLAEQLQTPVFVLTDLDLGMNNWMGRSFTYPDQPMQRGKVLDADEVRERGFARYRDVDGDGVTYRTLPGNDAPGAAYFARGTGHNAQAVYSERSDDWVENTERLARKFDTARRLVPPALDERVEGASVGLIAFGTTRYAIEEARDALAADGLHCSSMRVRALPIGEEVRAFIEAHERVVVIEMNRDAQLAAILRAELPDLAPRIESVAYLDGMPFTAGFMRERIEPFLTPRSLEVA
ncbi:MAG: 2-oxoacid:acceptor oxidoreductase subunit alpha [Trueperaceae bacterium]|nr:MAG: 2-oxoacid:acceptor oxidoreductase subunit alpha [Trueperaceae bacterium]